MKKVNYNIWESKDYKCWDSINRRTNPIIRITISRNVIDGLFRSDILRDELELREK